jgi:hypothetical protein
MAVFDGGRAMRSSVVLPCTQRSAAGDSGFLIGGAKNEIEKRRRGNFHERWQLLF